MTGHRLIKHFLDLNEQTPQGPFRDYKYPLTAPQHEADTEQIK